jgi:hypothetical protein
MAIPRRTDRRVAATTTRGPGITRLTAGAKASQFLSPVVAVATNHLSHPVMRVIISFNKAAVFHPILLNDSSL